MSDLLSGVCHGCNVGRRSGPRSISPVSAFLRRHRPCIGRWACGADCDKRTQIRSARIQKINLDMADGMLPCAISAADKALGDVFQVSSGIILKQFLQLLRQYRIIQRTRLDGSFCACYDVEILKNRLFSCDFSVKTGPKISRQYTHANCAVLP